MKINSNNPPGNGPEGPGRGSENAPGQVKKDFDSVLDSTQESEPLESEVSDDSILSKNFNDREVQRQIERNAQKKAAQERAARSARFAAEKEKKQELQQEIQKDDIDENQLVRDRLANVQKAKAEKAEGLGKQAQDLPEQASSLPEQASDRAEERARVAGRLSVKPGDPAVDTQFIVDPELATADGTPAEKKMMAQPTIARMSAQDQSASEEFQVKTSAEQQGTQANTAKASTADFPGAESFEPTSETQTSAKQYGSGQQQQTQRSLPPETQRGEVPIDKELPGDPPIKEQRFKSGFEGKEIKAEWLAGQGLPLASQIEPPGLPKTVAPSNVGLRIPQIEKIVDNVLVGLNASGQPEFKLDVNLAELGMLNVKVTRTEQGLAIYLNAESERAGWQMSQNLQQLQTMLTQKGLNVSNVQLLVQNQEIPLADLVRTQLSQETAAGQQQVQSVPVTNPAQQANLAQQINVSQQSQIAQNLQASQQPSEKRAAGRKDSTKTGKDLSDKPGQVSGPGKSK